MSINQIESFFCNHCNDKNYSIKKSDTENYLRINVSNLRETINVDIYKTGSIVIGGKKVNLKMNLMK